MDKQEEYNEWLKKLYDYLLDKWEYEFHKTQDKLYLKINNTDICVWFDWSENISYSKIYELQWTPLKYIIYFDTIYKICYVEEPKTPEEYLLKKIEEKYPDAKKTIDEYFNSKIEKIKHLIK